MPYSTPPSLEQAAARLFKLSPHLLYCLAADGRVLHVNPAFTSNLGWPEHYLNGRLLVELVHADDLPAMHEALASWSRGDEVGEIEVRVQCRAGGYRWLALVSSARDQDGTTYGIARDVEDRHKLEQQLRFQSELLDAVGQAVMATATDGTFTFWNRAAEEMYGWSASEAIGRHFRDLTPSSYSEAHGREIAACIDEGKTWSGEFVARRRDGSSFPVLASVAPVLEPNGALGGVVCVVADISETHRMNAALRESEEQSRRLNEMHQMILDHIPAMVTMTPPDGRHVMANREWSRITGLECREIAADGLMERLFPDPVKREEAGVFLMTADGSQRDFELVTKAGDSRDVRFTSVRLSDSSILGMGIDVTGQRRLEKQLRHAQKMEAIGRLAGGVAHDFNNVLTVISSYTELLLEDCTADSPMRPDLQEIAAAASRAARLTRQLLAFGRQQVMNPVVVDWRTVLKGLDTMLQKVVGAEIDLRISASSPTHVLADAGQLEQVVINLVVNAADAMPTGGTLDIDVRRVDKLPECVGDSTAAEGPFALLEVRDTGVGISTENMPRLFEPFFTTKEPGKGTGLGLPTVYGIVTQSNGFVHVKSAEGKGTTVSVYLPLTQVDDPRAMTPTSTPAIQFRQSANILLCEDEDALRTVMERVLVQGGYQVHTARNGIEAVALAERLGDTIDLLVTDIVMPEMNGIDAVELITQNLGDVPVLFMTGYSVDAVSNHGELRPGARLMGKPFTTRALLSTVAEMLGANTAV